MSQRYSRTVRAFRNFSGQIQLSTPKLWFCGPKKVSSFSNHNTIFNSILLPTMELMAVINCRSTSTNWLQDKTKTKTQFFDPNRSSSCIAHLAPTLCQDTKGHPRPTAISLINGILYFHQRPIFHFILKVTSCKRINLPKCLNLSWMAQIPSNVFLAGVTRYVGLSFGSGPPCRRCSQRSLLSWWPGNRPQIQTCQSHAVSEYWSVWSW